MTVRAAVGGALCLMDGLMPRCLRLIPDAVCLYVRACGHEGAFPLPFSRSSPKGKGKVAHACNCKLQGAKSYTGLCYELSD